MDTDIQTKPNGHWIMILSVFALILFIRLVMMIVSEPEFFPINVLKIKAPYHYLTREKIQKMISPYINKSFLVFSEENLKNDFKKNPWVEKILVKKIWPDRIIVQIMERFPVAVWNNMLLSDKGDLFKPDEYEFLSDRPHLFGPKHQEKEVLHIFEKLSKLLLAHDLEIKELRLRENQSWEMILSNGVVIRLGKREIEERLARFCKVYPKLFAMSFDRVFSIDLRYSNGMAVKWKKSNDQIISNPKKEMG